MACEPTLAEKALLLDRIRSLEFQLEEAEALLGAIRRGEIDAVVVSDKPGENRIFTLESTDHPYQVLIEQMQEGAVTLRADGTIMYSNRRMAAMLSIPQERIIGQNLQHFMLPDDAALFSKLLNETASEGARAELTMRAANGNEIPVNVSLNLLSGHEPRLLCGVLTDLTAQKVNLRALAEANDALTRMNEALKRSNSELDSFAYVASHDLKEPLRGISNFATFLRRSAEAKLNAEELGRIQTIIRLVRRMDDLTDALLLYSRIGRVELTLEAVDLNELLSHTLEALRPMLDERGVDVRVPRRLPTLQTDRVWLGEIFSNLISNAIKYNDHPAGERWVEIEQQIKDGQLVFSVRDNGIGIAPHHLEDVFRIFRRLHARDEYAGGNGAGLTIARRTVERLGGHLWAESEGLGGGSTFWFNLGGPFASEARL